MATTTVEQRLDRIEDSVKKIANQAVRPQVNGAPSIVSEGVRGESKPFSMHSFIQKGLAKGSWADAAYELEVSKKYGNVLRESGAMLAEAGAGGHWLPMNLNYAAEMVGGNSKLEADMRFVKSAVESAAQVQASFDPEEIRWMQQRGFLKAMTAYTDTTGGSLIAPPTMGPVNELIRPNAAALAAGATSITLPPSGRYNEPRITGAPTVNAVPESGTAIATDLTTDQIMMTAKKIVGAVVVTDEATNFSSGSIDTFSRMELDRSLGLKMDAYAFNGTGGTNIPAGITAAQYNITGGVFYVHSQTPTPRGVLTNGNVLLPEYGDIVEALIAERSFGMDGSDGSWVMRPGAWATVAAARADAITAGDKAGVKVDVLRRLSESMPTTWGQKKVVRTTNIRGDRTKNSGTSLQEVYYGIFKYMLIGTYGAVQFTEGLTNTQFLQGQKTIKATMYGDVAFRHFGCFAYYDAVIGASALL